MKFVRFTGRMRQKRSRVSFNQSLSLLTSILIAGSCVLSIGCDMGTYGERLKEKPAPPSPISDDDSIAGESTDDQ